MSKIEFTVLFNDPFWIGIFELTSCNEYKVCKVTFGSEPKIQEIYEFILKEFYFLNFSLPIRSNNSKPLAKKRNPKRIQRSIQKETLTTKGLGTKAQIAIKMQHEQYKIKNKKDCKKKEKLESEKKFYIKKKKRLEKHKGH